MENNYLKLVKSNKEKGCFNVLFLPGFPGKYRERSLTKDLKKLNFNIYSLEYPGTYNNHGIFSPSSVNDQIKNSVDYLNKLNLPTLVISYSFSTYFILKHIKNIRNLIGVFFFSPILDLKKSVSRDFISNLLSLSKNKKFLIDIKSFKQLIISDKISRQKIISEIAGLNKPLIYIVGEKDKVIRKSFVLRNLNLYRNSFGLNKISVIEIPNANHKLDSLYVNKIVYKYFVAMVFSQKISTIIPKTSTYLWGGSLNYRYSNPKSDLDIAILGRKFTFEDYVKLNTLLNQYSSKVDLTLDIIVNTYEELTTLERIRSNRGPSFIHELDYYYFPILKDRLLVLPKIKSNYIKKDAIFADSINFYKSKKALLNYPPGSSSSNWIVKNFIFACYYYQYLKGNFFVDQNKIESYFKNNKYVYRVLIMCKKLQNNQMKGVNLDMLKIVINTHKKLLREFHE